MVPRTGFEPIRPKRALAPQASASACSATSASVLKYSRPPGLRQPRRKVCTNGVARSYIPVVTPVSEVRSVTRHGRVPLLSPVVVTMTPEATVGSADDSGRHGAGASAAFTRDRRGSWRLPLRGPYPLAMLRVPAYGNPADVLRAGRLVPDERVTMAVGLGSAATRWAVLR